MLPGSFHLFPIQKPAFQKCHGSDKAEILRQFERQGLSIYEGIAVDARLVQSASRPVSNDKIKELRVKHQTPEGKIDKNGNPKKFTRDLESGWNAKDGKNPHYGLKEHTSVDANYGFVLATALTPASESDTRYFPYCTVFSHHTKQPIQKAYADKGYFGEPNRSFLSENKIEDGIMRKDTTTAKFTRLNMFLEHLLEGKSPAPHAPEDLFLGYAKSSHKNPQAI